MSNRKLKWWARLTFRTVCGHCGELYATTTADGPSCAICAAWIAAGAPADDSDFDVVSAADQLPYLLRHRASVRQLNWMSRPIEHHTDAERADDAYNFLREYHAASWPVRHAFNAGQFIGQCRRTARYHAVNVADWVRITATRPDCARCGGPATTTFRLRDDSPDRTALCDACCFAINDGAGLPGGAK